MKMPSQNKLNEIFEYCENSGILRWKHDRGYKVKAGDIAGSVFKRSHNKKPYRQVSLDRMVYRVHRVVWKMLHGIEPEQIDHEDGNGLNNKLENLRSCGAVDNAKNNRLYKTNKSGYAGIKKTRSNKFIAVWSISKDGIRKGGSIGTFSEIWDAICARKLWEARNGFHSNNGTNRAL